MPEYIDQSSEEGAFRIRVCDCRQLVRSQARYEPRIGQVEHHDGKHAADTWPCKSGQVSNDVSF